MHQESLLPRGSLLVIGGCLIAGFVSPGIVGDDSSLEPVWKTGSAQAVTLIGGELSGNWRWGNWTFAVGIWLTLAGLATLTVLLDRRPRPPVLPRLALALATAATILWTINLTFRLTVMPDVAAAGPAVPDWYPPVAHWADEGLLNAAALTGGPALILYGIAVATERVLARWTGWFAAAGGLVLLGQSILTGAVIPLILYVAPLPLGIAALIRAARRAPRLAPAAPEPA